MTHIVGHVEQLCKIADVVARSSAFPAEPPISRSAVFRIAMVANGLSPASLIRTVRNGPQLDGLRGSRLDKRGVCAASSMRPHALTSAN
jgi:hypothetical protein